MKKRLEPYTAYLLIAEKGAIIEYAFNYREAQNRRYQTTATGSGFEFVAVTENIYTSNTELPFSSDSKIRLSDGRVLSIEIAEPDKDEFKATFDGVGLIGWYLHLNGGGE